MKRSEVAVLGTVGLLVAGGVAFAATQLLGAEAPDISAFDRATETETTTPRARQNPTTTATATPVTIDIEARYDDVVASVEDVRELSFARVLEPTYETFAEIAQRVNEARTRYVGASQANLEQRVLVALGAIPANFDLRGEQLAIATEPLFGYYDSFASELVVGVEGLASARPVDEVVLAHELAHALSDQALGFPDALFLAEELDEFEALSSLIEGDATNVEDDYLASKFTPAEQQAIQRDLDAVLEGPRFQSLPHYLRRQSRFAYEEGAEFVASLRQQGGWDAVDAAYKRVPTSTAQILFPELYIDRVHAKQPSQFADLDPPWTNLGRVAFGASNLLFLLEAPGGEVESALRDPLDRVRDWAGGAYQLWIDGPSSAVGLVLVRRDALDRLCETVEVWYRAAFPRSDEGLANPSEAFAMESLTGQDAIVECTEDDVRLAIAPDLATARAMLGTG